MKDFVTKCEKYLYQANSFGCGGYKTHYINRSGNN